MNKERRKRIEDCVARLYDLQEEIGSIRDDEQESRDNLPDNLYYSQRADRMDEVIDGLDEIWGDIDTMIDNLNALTE